MDKIFGKCFKSITSTTKTVVEVETGKKPQDDDNLTFAEVVENVAEAVVDTIETVKEVKKNPEEVLEQVAKSDN